MLLRSLVRRFHSSLATGIEVKQLSYNGIEINIRSDVSCKSFEEYLSKCVKLSKMEQKSTIFIRVPIAQSNLIPISVNFGFQFHHAEGDYSYLMLWLKDGECKVPSYATHHVGVGGVVVNDDKILLVKESDKHGWKFPGGYVNLGEEFGDAATREIYEETGISTQFEKLLAIRHSHNTQFGRDDIYALCLLKLTEKSQQIVIDSEIDDAQWIKIKDFKEINKAALNEKVLWLLEQQSGLVEEVLPSIAPNRPPFRIYH